MKLTASIAALLLGTTAMAQTAPAADAPKPPPPTWTFALKGFVSMSSAYQTGLFNAEGQLSNYAATPEATLKDDSSLAFDVRHSRFNFSVKGPQLVMGATPSGILEIDFMGGWGAGANGSASLMNRLRVAVVELNWGNHKLQFGQQNDLIFAAAPTSLSHIGQPLGYATGNTGWRRPGVFGFHVLPVMPDLKLELAWEVARGNWNDTGACVVTQDATAPALKACSGVGAGFVNTPGGGIMAAEASSMPAFEGRATANYGKLATVWVAGHYHQVDLSGVGTGASIAAGGTNAGLVKTLGVSSYNAGAKLTFDVQPVSLTLQGAGFVGKNATPLVANFGSYRIGTDAKPDVGAFGYWAQGGVGFDKLSLWVLYGQQKVDEKDFARTAPTSAAAFENATTNVMAMYRDGGFGFSVEWINFQTKYAKTVDAAAEKVTASFTSKADQYMATANYFF